MLKKTHFSIICAAVMSFMVSTSFAEPLVDSNPDSKMSKEESDHYVSKTVDGKMAVVAAPNKKDQNKLLNWEEKMKEEKEAKEKKLAEEKHKTLEGVHKTFPGKVVNQSEKVQKPAAPHTPEKVAPAAKPAVKPATAPVVKPAAAPHSKPTPGKVTHDPVAPKTKVSDWQKMMDQKQKDKEMADAKKKQEALDAELQHSYSEDGSKPIVNKSEEKHPKAVMTK